jgi:S1-C subfamily serine protease
MSDAQSGHEHQAGAGDGIQHAPWGPPAPGGPGWPTMPIGYGYPGEWGGGQPPRRRRGPRAAAFVAMIIVGAAVGAGLTRVAWGSAPAANTTAQGNSPAPAAPARPAVPGSGNAGSGNPGGQFPYGSGNPYSQQPGGTGGAPPEGSGGPSDVASIAARVDPALADVNTTFGYQQASGAGTGIVLTSTGEILTNNHVIDGATSVSVTDVGNGRTYAATVVGYDSTHDIAVLQLKDASGLRTAALAGSATATVGEPVVAIGNAGGTGGTPTSAGGSLTALDQAITASDSLDGTSEQLSGLLETNADVQAGDSGGSLVNSAGQVIGMDTAASDGFSFQSSGTQGFAIPIGQALATARQIESGDGSSVVHVGPAAFLGVQVSASDQGDSGFPGGGYPGSASPGPSGAAVENVISGTGAQQAGLQPGDVITSLGGHAVASPAALSRLLVGYHPGDSVQIGWTDPSGQSHTAAVDLGSGPPA